MRRVVLERLFEQTKSELQRVPRTGLVFVTKSTPNFRRVLGYEPEPGMAMTGVVDVGQVRDVIKVIDDC